MRVAMATVPAPQPFARGVLAERHAHVCCALPQVWMELDAEGVKQTALDGLGLAILPPWW